MNIIKKIWIAVAVTFTGFAVAPLLAFAQAAGSTFSNATGASGATTLSQTSNLNDLVAKIIGFFNVGVYLIVALAIFVFVWNVYKYFITDDPENKKEGGKYVMYSVLGIFIILSFWGLVNLVSNTLNINTSPGSVNVGNLIGNITGGSGGTGTGAGSNYSNSSLFNPSGTGSTGANSGIIGGSGSVSSANLSAMQANFQANCTNSAGQPILISSNCQNLSSQIQSAQSGGGSGSGSTFSNSSGGNGYCASDETMDQYGDCINNAFLYGDDSSSGSGSGSGGSGSGSSVSSPSGDQVDPETGDPTGGSDTSGGSDNSAGQDSSGFN